MTVEALSHAATELVSISVESSTFGLGVNFWRSALALASFSSVLAASNAVLDSLKRCTVSRSSSCLTGLMRGIDCLGCAALISKLISELDQVVQLCAFKIFTQSLNRLLVKPINLVSIKFTDRART